MQAIWTLCYGVWQKKPFRWLITVTFSAFLGIAAGHTVIGSLSGSVSVVDGTSMVPTYKPGARVYTGPITTPLERGDIVLIDDGGPDYALKRIVGMPGETIHLWRGYVFINRKMLREPYLPRYTFTFPSQSREVFKFSLGPDEYFVLGDNRVCSIDSRAYGPVPRKHIKSRVPLPESRLVPSFADYTLPAEGKRTIRALQPGPIWQ
jgi:signal peptidase I